MKLTLEDFNILVNQGSAELATDLANMGKPSCEADSGMIRSTLLANSARYCEANDHLTLEQNLDVMTQTVKCLYSEEFEEILNDDTISIQPMTGPVGLAIGVYITAYETAIQKTAVESGTRRFENDFDFGEIVDELRLRQKQKEENGENSHIIYCPYIMVMYVETRGDSYFSRYGVIDHLMGENIIIEG
jgi:hypothetical protein|tara:strand:+ start:51920 stop:52486 length:567 start_codon:yes stop_codon:yes gene_type:complete